MLLVYTIGFMFLIRTIDISEVFNTALKLTIESILAYGITLIIKYSKIKNNEIYKN